MAIQIVGHEVVADSSSEPWITTADAARHLRVTPEWLTDCVRRGVGPPSHKIPNGREYRWRYSELDAWLEKSRLGNIHSSR
jgi:excisionase family DNA binding protein